MKGLIQRVNQASVTIDNQVVADIGTGILLLLGVEKTDSSTSAEKLLHRVLNYRIFSDAQGKMNRSLLDVQGELLVVSQFTLVANTQKGLRPSFSSAASPEQGAALYRYFIEYAAGQVHKLAHGQFGADMKVSLINDGPVTFLLEV